jgi:metallo-beta-lactamase family protein
MTFDPGAVDAVALSHAHIDHCGNLPSLAAAGYRGPIRATSATTALCGIMLRDAAYIQEQDAAYLNQKTSRRGLPPVEPLYTTEDAETALQLFRSCRYHETSEAAPGIRVESLEAGHILGADLAVFSLEEGPRKVRLGFAVDLGRRDLPLIRDPDLMPPVDVLVLESTYGDRHHEDTTEAGRQLGEIVRRTVQRGGKVLIPSFALERAQELLYHLAELRSERAIPDVPVYVDSPMATAVTRVFASQSEYLDRDFHALRERLGRVLESPWIHFVSSVKESKELTASKRPCVVIAASGMCEHGRILHHLKHGITDARNTVAIVGFQARHTLGRRLVEGASTVRVFGEPHECRAEVDVLHAFSAHADRDDLLEYARRVDPKRIFLVHGEERAREALAQGLRETGAFEVLLPRRGEAAEL